MVIPWGLEPGLRNEHAAMPVADGVYRFGANVVNWYLLEGEDGLTVVDAGLPDHWELLADGLDSLGYGVDDVEALVLTHADPDHLGFAERLRGHGVPVWVHEADHDAALAGGADLPLRTLLHLWRPPLLRFLRAQMRAGVGETRPVAEARTFTGGEELPVPGQPTVVHLPGHTEGECAFWLPDRAVLLAGDALVTMDPLRGRTCPPSAPRLANTDDELAYATVRRLTGYGELTVLPGHGEPWTGKLDDVFVGDASEPSGPRKG